MIPALDIYRTAALLMKRHGDDASIQAAMRADGMLEAGDLRYLGGSAWGRWGGVVTYVTYVGSFHKSSL